MSKREISMFAAQGVDVDAPRAKRQRTAAAAAPTSNGTDTARVNGAEGSAGDNGKLGEDQTSIKEKGMKLWQTIKEATDKDGRVMSPVFMRLPTKKQYPDYYVQIKHPIALEDIKRKLERGQYPTFDDVRQDLEQCFKNAKKFNMKESQIWLDAKQLHKLVTKEASRLSGKVAEGEDEGEGEGSDGEEKKKKAPNMHRLLKARLQKLVDKTDDQGRVLSAEFMELPNKKQWPIYYKAIKNPQCLENIFKRLKRKEYHTALDFANDVELVFSNALEFNQEHTQIWEDAMVLRDNFRQLMSDLPPPFSIPAYSSPDHSTKIKLKVPQASTAAAATSPRPKAPKAAAAPQTTAMSTFTSVMSPPAAPKPTPATVTAPTPTASTSQLAAMATTPAVPPAPYTPSFTQSYTTPTFRANMGTPVLPNTNSINVARAPPVSIPTPAPPVPQPPPQFAQLQMPNVVAKSPTPPETGRQLRHVSIVTQPLGRRLELDYRDGVRVWTVRLGPGESSARVSGIKFLGDDGEDHSDEENHRESRREEEEEEEEEEESQDKKRRGRHKKKRGERSPKGKGKVAVRTAEPEVQVKLNGAAQQSVDGEDLIWDVFLPTGQNIVEVGGKGGRPWRVYLDRIAMN